MLKKIILLLNIPFFSYSADKSWIETYLPKESRIHNAFIKEKDRHELKARYTPRDQQLLMDDEPPLTQLQILDLIIKKSIHKPISLSVEAILRKQIARSIPDIPSHFQSIELRAIVGMYPTLPKTSRTWFISIGRIVHTHWPYPIEIIQQEQPARSNILKESSSSASNKSLNLSGFSDHSQ